MVVSRAIRATGCASCRLSLLRTFSSVAGIPIRPPQAPARFSAYNVSTKARYSSRVNPDDQHESNPEQPIKVSEQEVEDFLKEEEEEDTVSYKALAEEEEATDGEISNVPWYLQVESPQRVQRTLSDRQRIPELPESPPEILEPLLQQISVDLGLDDLTLLDLRKLDPPPALGSNLIMIIGTARSEKHLHVSADRLCRWLRSTYKLRPDADGLLGRNELKLKLKRKSRRAKLMGNAQADETDDGVRTGWVCVNVGVVEDAKVEVEAPAENAGFVGFGRRTDGISIVVQMLTEEKRAEVDLEKLWGGILRRGTQQLEGTDGENAKLPVFSAVEPAKKTVTNSSPILSQTRRFHTSARDRTMETLTVSLNETSSFPGNAMLQSRSEAIDLDRLREHVLNSISNGDYEIAKDTMIKYCATNSDIPVDEWRPVFLDMLRVHLESSPQEFAHQLLGSSSTDYTSTPFLKSFYQSLSTLPSQSEWEARIWLHCFAREVGHEGYYMRDLLKTLAELHLSAGQVSEATYLRALHSMLLPAKGQDSPHPYGTEGAMRLLQTMYDRGLPIISHSVFMTIIEATANFNATTDPKTHISNENPKETFGLPDIKQPPIQERAHILMGMLGFRDFPEESRIRLLDIYARQQTWLAFWDTFRMSAREGKPRSAAMYACMFKNVALARNQAACMNVLRKWVPEMEQEEPSVALDGEIRLPVMACVKIADPLVDQDAADSESKSEWVALWRKCVEDVRHEA